MSGEKKQGVLLMAYGSPEREEDVAAYYTHIRGGRKPSPEELENLKSRYKSIGGRSPLLRITNSTAEKLQNKLEKQGKQVRVYAGMKHWHPFISETFDQILHDGITDLVGVALAPHYSKMSIGSYHDSLRKANDDHRSAVEIKYVEDWHLDPVFIAKWKERISKASKEKFNAKDPGKIFYLFTAHSLPERILTWNDPYERQLLETADELAKELKIDSNGYGFAFQSAGHTSEPWLGPDILDKLRELSKEGLKKVLVIPIGFVSDHLEILFDIDVEAKQLARELDMRVERTDSFNDSDEFVEILSSVVMPYLSL
jgi:protoporphyrin/coproporphyrin ferrochelatase